MDSEQRFLLARPEPSSPEPQLSAERLLYLGVLLGVFLIGLGVLWVGLLRGENIVDVWFKTEDVPVVQDIGLGIVIGTAFSTILWFIGQHYSGFTDIRERLVKTLDLANFRLWHIVLLSLVAAVPEEIFFRGTVQPVLGLLLTSVIFGVLHALTPVYFIYAMTAGLGLGLMADWHESLWLPIAAHFAVDVVSLYIMARWAAQNQTVQTSVTMEDVRESEPFS